LAPTAMAAGEQVADERSDALWEVRLLSWKGNNAKREQTSSYAASELPGPRQRHRRALCLGVCYTDCGVEGTPWCKEVRRPLGWGMDGRERFLERGCREGCCLGWRYGRRGVEAALETSCEVVVFDLSRQRHLKVGD
jgi:hypothetical protein